jgi:hypothetical protein
VDLFQDSRVVVQEAAIVTLATCTTPLRFNFSDSISKVATGRKPEMLVSVEHAPSPAPVYVARARELSEARQCLRKSKQAANAIEIILVRVEIIVALMCLKGTRKRFEITASRDALAS